MLLNTDVELGFKTMRFPKDKSDIVDEDEFKRMVDYYMSQGFNYFDTSYAYHHRESERVLKSVLIDRYPRESYRIADKLPACVLNKPEDNEKIINSMLERFDIKYFDVFLLQIINNVSFIQAENAEFFEYIRILKENGKILDFGISFHSDVDLLEEILKKYGDVLDFVQLQVNFLDWDDNSFYSRKCHKLTLKYGLDLIVTKSFKGGDLLDCVDDFKVHFDYLDVSVSEMALRFAGSLGNVRIVLASMDTLKQVKENCRIFKDFKHISNGEYYFLMTLAEEVKKTNY